MHKLERVSLVLFLVCATLSFLRVPTFALFATLVGLTLSSYYFIAGFGICNNIPFKRLFKKDTYSSIGVGNIVWGQLAGMWVYSICIIGILFAVTQKPGSHIFLLVSLLNFVVAIPLALIIFITKKSSIARDHLIRSIFFLLVCGALYLLVPKGNTVHQFIDAETAVNLKSPDKPNGYYYPTKV